MGKGGLVPAFRVYYDGGATYDGDPFWTPVFGVLVIVEQDPDHGRRLVSAKDYYVWEHKRWWAVDFVGMVDYLARPGPRRVLFGRTVPNDVWYAAMRRANEDPDFPAPTAWASN